MNYTTAADTFRCSTRQEREAIIRNLESKGYVPHLWMEVSNDGNRIIYCVEGHAKMRKRS